MANRDQPARVEFPAGLDVAQPALSAWELANRLAATSSDAGRQPWRLVREYPRSTATDRPIGHATGTARRGRCSPDFGNLDS